MDNHFTMWDFYSKAPATPQPHPPREKKREFNWIFWSIKLVTLRAMKRGMNKKSKLETIFLNKASLPPLERYYRYHLDNFV